MKIIQLKIIVFILINIGYFYGCSATKGRVPPSPDRSGKDISITMDSIKSESSEIISTPPRFNPVSDLMYRRRWDKALESLKTAVYMDTMDRLFLAGYANMKMENYSTAESLFAILFSMEYDLNDWVTFFLMKSAFHNDDYKLAYQLSLTSGGVPGYENEMMDIRWRSLWEMGQKKQAMNILDSLYKAGVIDKWDYTYNKAICLKDTGNYSEARNKLNYILKNLLGNRNFCGYVISAADRLSEMENLTDYEIKLLAETYYYCEHWGEALKWFKEIDDEKMSSRLRYFQARCRLKIYNYSDALKEFQQLLAEQSYDRSSLWWQIGYCHRKLNNYQSALTAQDSALEYCNNSITRVNILREKIFLGRDLNDWNLIAKASKDLARADAGGSDGSIGMIWSAIGYIQSQQLDSAITVIRKYRKLFSDKEYQDELSYWESRILRFMGDTVAADSILQILSEQPRHNLFVWLARQQFGDTLLPPDKFVEFLPIEMDSLYNSARDIIEEKFGKKIVQLPENSLMNKAERLAQLGLMDLARVIYSDLEGSNAFPKDIFTKLELWRYYYSLRLYSLAAKKGSSICSKFDDPPLEILRLNYITPFPECVNKYARRENVNPLFIYSVMTRESYFDVYARSWANARGLMQFIPKTAREVAGWLNIQHFKLIMLYDYDICIQLGAKLLSELLSRRNNTAFALAEYNAGNVPVDKWTIFCPDTNDYILCTELIDYRQTRIFAKKIMGYYWLYNWLYKDRYY
ncbi:hypothetical protein DRQ33_06875, partial [bacterium]